jgi:hypothetical protein
MPCSLGRLLTIGACPLMLAIVRIPTLHAQAPIPLDVQHADARETLHALAQAGSLNMVIGPEVTHTAGVRLRDVPVDEALETPLRVTGLVEESIDEN